MANSEPVAIIGMAGRFPGAEGIDRFWQNIVSGVRSLTTISDEELLEWGEEPANLTDPSYVRRRPLLEDAAAFDTACFGMTPREAEIRDPQYRLMLETVHAALEHAGYDPSRYEGSIGVYAGSNVNRYRYDYVEQHPDLIRTVGLLAVDIANAPDYLSNFVSYKLGLRGPAMTVLTACSSSLVAVHLACASLINGDSTIAVAGGVDLEFPFNRGYEYLPGSIGADDGIPRPFDADATGTNFGNGTGAVVLKPLAAALADGDTVYAVIRGTAVNNDGNRKAGFSAPSVAGQSECIQAALRAADVDPRTITLVEAHGTATPVGDPIELAGLVDAFQAVAGGDLQPHSCAIGSVKSNIGHLGQAAGIAGLIKATLALHHRTIPASINFATPNPAVDWSSSPFAVATETRPWTVPEGLARRASVSSFGVGGTNAHAVLEEAPALAAAAAALPEQGLPERELVVWSAADETAAEALRERLQALGVDCYTGNRARAVHGGTGVPPAEGWGRVGSVELASGYRLDCDLVVLACGTRPRTALAHAAGLPVATGVLVDDRLAAAPHVSAIGDCAEHRGTVHGLAGPAWEQADVLARRLSGAEPDARYPGTSPRARLSTGELEYAAFGAVDESLDPGLDVLRLTDATRGSYKKLVLRGDRLVGAILLGDLATVDALAGAFADGGALAGHPLHLLTQGAPR